METKGVISCPYCEREFRNKRGVHVHVADHLRNDATESDVGNRTESGESPLGTESQGMQRQTSPTIGSAMNPQGNENQGECINCKLNEYKLEIKEKELATAREVAAATISDLRSKVAELSVPRPEPVSTLPGVREFLQHCESGNCEHAQEWQTVKTELIQDALDKVPDDVLKQKVFDRGLIPRSITVKNVEKLIQGLS